jgi:hypothetical protein
MPEEPISFPTRLRLFAERIGAEEYGFYFIIDGERVVVPFSLTTIEQPEPTTAPSPPPADPRPESPNDPAG